MAGHKKSSSHENRLFAFGHFYGCFIWRCTLSKKRRSLSDPKSKHRRKSNDEIIEASEASSEETQGSNDKIHELRPHQGNNEVHPNNSTSISPFSRSPSPLSSQTSRALSQTQSCKLRSSITRQSADMTKPSNVNLLKRRGLSHQLETKSLGRTAGSMAHSGPILRGMSRISGSPAIVYSRSNGLLKLLMVEESLDCSLEELCFGCVKNISVLRAVIANNGRIDDEEETLSIKVKPGWTKGTTITFEGRKNEEKGTHSCDVIFVVTEKKHELYRKEGDDLELVVRIPLLQALTGFNISVPLLGGNKMKITFDEIIEPGYEKVIEGQGMPKSKEQGQRGNLKIIFLVDFPQELTDDQKSDLASILQDSY